MLHIKNLSYSIGERELIKGIDWIIRPKVRSALIGPNGAGKTTLLKIVNGDLKSQDGTILKPKNYKIGYLPQEEIVIDKGQLLQTVLQGRIDILEIENKIQHLHESLNTAGEDNDDLLKQLGAFEQKYEALQGYQLESRAKAILSGLGFQESDFEKPLSDFSGGWRMRCYLARLLIQEPDLLLLDEPTNHLDLPSLEWLEQYLFNFDGSMIIVSHDRFFIDRLAHDIYELDMGNLEYYHGNYHFYEQKKKENLELLQKKWEEQRADIERQEKFINRFRYKATKAVQVQSRIKKLEKLETIEIPPEPPKVNFQIKTEIQSYKEVLIVENMSFRYNHEWVLQNVNLNLYRGEKIAVVGVNGAGKTTLTRLIFGQLKPQQGEIIVGNRTKIGYYAQHQIDILNLNATVYDEIVSSTSFSQIPKIRNVLGIFQLRGDDAFKKIEVLSGGEKARVSLSKILLSPVNFLIMDEPTNHLDISSKEALENALVEYDGTLLIISHDRYFLDKIVSRVIEINNKTIKEYEGNYSDYLAKRETEIQQINLETKQQADSSKAKKTKQQKRLEAEARQNVSKRRNELNMEIETLEQKIETLETRKKEIEEKMSRPETYQDGEHIAYLQKEYTSIKHELAECYEKWEEVQTEIEDLLTMIATNV